MATATSDDTRTKSNTGYMIAGVATAGFAAGILAMIGRKVMVQAPTYLAGDWDQALAAEHAATLKLFDALENTPAHGARRSMLLTQLKHALAKHALEEENAVYPALRDIGETDAADELNREHGYVKQYLYDLTKLSGNDAAFLAKLRTFRGEIEEHMRDEEDRLFPLLKRKLGEEQNAQLTSDMNKEGFKLA